MGEECSFNLKQVVAIECQNANKFKDAKIVITEPFFKCECDDHDTKLLYSLEEGQKISGKQKHVLYDDQEDVYIK